MRPDETRINVAETFRCCINSIGKQMLAWQEEERDLSDGSTVECEHCQDSYILKEDKWRDISEIHALHARLTKAHIESMRKTAKNMSLPCKPKPMTKDDVDELVNKNKKETK